MKRSIFTLTIAATLSLSSVVSAESIGELQNKQSEISGQRSNINSKIKQADDKISEIKGQQKNVLQEISRIDAAVSDTNTKITEKTGQIKVTKAEVQKLQKEIVILKKRIKKRNELLKERARSLQENGGSVNYLDVLLGSESFGDFIDRLGAVSTIVEADQDILRQHEADKKSLEKKEAKVKKDLASLEKMLNELQSMKQQLNSQKAEKDRLMASLKEQQNKVEHEKLSLAEQESVLAAQESAIQKAIQLEQQKLASQNQPSAPSGGGGGGSLPPVSSGTFTKPAQGIISSGFGWRDGRMHFGVDIAANGYVPIVAAADGVVIQSWYSDSYGNCIFIAHSINGRIYTTVYAHMSQRLVGAGTTVSKGQQIGVMGNTGWSYGQHLHFELHNGQWNGAKSNAINPTSMVPM